MTSLFRRFSLVLGLARSILIVLLATPVWALLTWPGASPAAAQDDAAPAVDAANSPTLLVDAPATAVTGSPFALSVTIDSAATVAAYRADIAAVGTEIEPSGQGRLNPADLVTDRSIGSLGDTAVLAATSCPAEGCNLGTPPIGVTGTFDAGSVDVTPETAGTLQITIELTELVAPDGTPIGNDSPLTSITIEVLVSGPDQPRPVPVAAADGDAEGDPQANGPNADEAEDDPDGAFAEAVADGCDPAADDCPGVAAIQMAEADPEGDAEPAAAAPAQAAAAAGPAALTLVVDSASDSTAYDTNQGDGLCTTPAGACTLRAAMQEANAFPGHVLITFDIAGAGPHTINLANSLPATQGSDGMTIDGYTQPGSAANTDPLVSNAVIMIEIRGAGPTGFDGFKLRGDNSVVRGLAVYDLRRPIWIRGGDFNQIVGNFIGTNSSGTFTTATLAPAAHGIHIEEQANDNVIGTPDVADRNVVSGNARHGIGIWHTNSDNNVVQNNIVGLTPDGSGALANAKHGIDVNFMAANTLVGGLGPGEGNLVSGNLDSGIEVSHNEGDQNGDPVSMDTRVLGNRIGTLPDGESYAAFTANANTGVYVEDAVDDTLVEGNVIVNNDRGGIRVINGGNGTTLGTVIRNNWIGVSPGGVPMPNGQVGVAVEASSTTVGPGNIIAHTSGPAFTSTELDAVANTVTRNTMVGNAGLGIELSPNGVNPNDPGDIDDGPNGRLNHPEIARATTEVVEGTACVGCTVEFFAVDTTPGAGLAGADFLGDVTTDPATGAFIFELATVAEDEQITATATDLVGNTSEFTPAVTVTEHSEPPVVDAGPDTTVNEGSTVQLAATGTDPDDDPLTYAWDLDGDGDFETPGQTAVFDAATIDGPTTQLVAVTATDDTGLSAIDEVTVTIANAPPTATLQVPVNTAEASTFAVAVNSPDDPSPADVAAGLRYAIGCGGETPTNPGYAAASVSPARTCLAPNGPASLDVEAWIIDADDGATLLSAPITIDNVAPTVAIGGVPSAADEGDQLNLTTTVTDPSASDEAAGFTYSWEVDLDGETVQTGTTPNLDVDLTDNGTWTLSVYATDADGGVATDVQVLTVNNVDPVAELATEVTVSGQVDVTLSLLNPTDPGPDDVAAGLRYAFSCDGTPITADYASAATSPTTTCTYTSGQTSYPVSALIVDVDGGHTEFATTVSVGDNLAPTVTVAPTFAVDEGGLAVLSADGVDPEGGAVTYDWDLDGDGTFETPGQTPTFDAAALNGPSSAPIAVQVTDAVGLSASATSTVQVANVAPSATLDPQMVDEGSTVTIDLSSATDPAPEDQLALRYAVDCAGGSLAAVGYAAAATEPTFECPFDDGPASSTITAKVLDPDGASTETSATVTVVNVDPTVTITPPTSNPAEGDAISIPVAATDPSNADLSSLALSWTVTFDPTGAVIASGTGPSAEFTAPDDGTVTVTAVATDKDGGTANAQTAVTVDGIAPAGSFVVPAAADQDEMFPIEIVAGTDPGPDDLAAGLRYAFSCDGTPITADYETASAVSQASCPASGSGSQDVLGRIIDADELFTDYTATVEIGNVAPQARFVVPRQGLEGRTITIAAADPSEADVTYAFDCGAGLGPFGTTNTAGCLLAGAGPQTVGLAVRDSEGLTTTYNAVVVVHADLGGNGGFETDADGDGTPDGWTLPGSGAVQVVPSAHHGSAALAQTSSGFKSSSIRTGRLAVTRAAVEVSAMVHVVDPGSAVSVQAEVTWYDGAGGAISTSRTDALTSATGGWVELSKHLVAPNGTTEAKLRVRIITDGGAAVQVDDVVLRHDNEVRNPDLDIDDNDNNRPDSWWSSSRFTRTDVTVHDTAWAGELLRDGANYSIGQRIRSVAAGETYHVSLWVNIPAEMEGTKVQLRTRWKDANDQNIGGIILLDQVTGPTTGWVQLHGTITAPQNADEANLDIRIANGPIGTIGVDSAYCGLS